MSKMAICRLLEKESATNLLKNVNNFVFDCDGVLWNVEELISGTKELLTKLQQLGKRVFLLSNNSVRSRSQYVQKCVRLGLPQIPESDVACTSYGVAHHLHSTGFKGKVYLMGNEHFGAELTKFGIPFIGVGPDPIVGDVTVWREMKLDPEVKCVVVGLDKDTSYLKVMKAASYLRDPKCLFVATNEDYNMPLPGGIVIPGTGTIVAPVKLAAGREPFVIGKPTTNLMKMLAKEHNIDIKKSVIVGDSIKTDITMGNACEMYSILVGTGVSTIEEVRKIEADGREDTKGLIPTFYTHSVKDIYNFIADL